MEPLDASEVSSLRRALEERRGFRVPAWVDSVAESFSERVSARQPRCDLTIGQLPLLAGPSSTALIPVYQNGQTYATPIPTTPVSIVQPNIDISALSIFNVKHYGATGNGTTDDTAAILATATAAIAAGGGIVSFPAGTFICNLVYSHGQAGLNINTPVYFVGVGIDATILKASTPNIGGVLSLSGSGGIMNMTLDGGAQATSVCGLTNFAASAVINLQILENLKIQNSLSSATGWLLVSNANPQINNIGAFSVLVLNNITLNGPSSTVQDAMGISNVATCYASNMTFNNLARTPNFYYIDNLFLNNIKVTGGTLSGSTGSFVIDAPVNHARVSKLYIDESVDYQGQSLNPFLLNSADCILDQCYVGTRTRIYFGGYAPSSYPAAPSSSPWTWTNSTGGIVYVRINPAGSAITSITVNGINIGTTNPRVWSVPNGQAMVITWTGSIPPLVQFGLEVKLTNFITTGDVTIDGTGAVVAKLSITGGKFAPRYAAANCIRVTSTTPVTQYWQFTGALFDTTNITTAVFGVDAGSTNLTDSSIDNCKFIGTYAATLHNVVPATGTKIVNNMGFNPVGNLSSPPTTTFVSGTLYTNTTGYDCTVFLVTAGGVTVSAIALGGTATGLTMTASSNLGVFLPAGQTIKLTSAGGNATGTWFAT